MGEQLARDVRTRLLAAAAVVLVHAGYPPGHPALVSLPRGAQAAVAALFTVLVAFPVNAFVLLSFLGVSVRLESGAAASQVVRVLARRLVPVHLFWATAFLAAKAIGAHALPSARAVCEGILLGRAAAHLYFIPQLLTLTAAVPMLRRLTRTAASTVVACAALALLAVAGESAWRDASAWRRFVVGFLGLAPFALAGLALARAWGGMAPGRHGAQLAIRVAGPVAVASAVALAHLAITAKGAPIAFTAARWLANAGLAIAFPVLLLSWSGPIPARLIRLAPYTLGVYVVHPFFLQALRGAEGHVAASASARAALILPNAAIAAALSVALVVFLSRTSMRRFVL